ncbi:MAG: rRNA pseudouridine synthase [Clostridia bacterium]|nr:rRNA pseudouridine synthase [Clostridia bacterium]
MRLDKLIASNGAFSRRQAADAIRRGRVAVNGEPAVKPDAAVTPGADRITVDGEPFLYSPNVYYMLNKPAGYVSSTEGRDTVIALLGEDGKRPGLFPCGRLDIDTVGLLLITDDGPLSHLLLSPRRHVEKEYFFTCSPALTDEGIKMIENGVDLGDFTAKPARIAPSRDRLSGTVAVTEGKYHQVKRMLSRAGSEVTTLKRVRFGPLSLDPDLAPGEYRPLTEDEISALRRAADKEGIKP